MQTGLAKVGVEQDDPQAALDQLATREVTIRAAIKSEPWPSKSASLEYCAVWTSRPPLQQQAECILDGVVVRDISPSLDPASRVGGNPKRLASNVGISFQASKLDGIGFTMESEEAQQLIEQDPRNGDVLFPYINGRDVNSRPDCSASRWVINFHDWPEEKAREYPECYERVVRLVKPERMKNNRKIYRDYWWQYAEKRPGMLKATADLERVIVITQISKSLMPVILPTGQVISKDNFVFATANEAMLALLSSSLHYWWAIRHGPKFETRPIYTSSDVFETFALPELTEEMRGLGDRLDRYRRELMLRRNAGLTATYNLVHDPACGDDDIVELRRIHRDIDAATVRAYGWDDLLDQLDHGHHPVARETRYTIGPTVRQEILDRLLELNHARYAEEVAAGLHDKRNPRKPTPNDGALF